jgi:hypothetical protein
MGNLVLSLPRRGSDVSETSSWESESSSEAMALIKRCAEPRPVNDYASEAINRAAVRLGFAPGRAKSIWYGEARRIDAREMDRLRAVADAVEIEAAVHSIAALRRRMSLSNSPLSREVVDRLDDCLRTLGSGPLGIAGDERGRRR